MQDGFSDFFGGYPNIEGSAHVYLQLCFTPAQGGEDTEGYELAASWIKTRPVIDIAEGKGCDVVGKSGVSNC